MSRLRTEQDHECRRLVSIGYLNSLTYGLDKILSSEFPRYNHGNDVTKICRIGGDVKTDILEFCSLANGEVDEMAGRFTQAWMQFLKDKAVTRHKNDCRL